MTETQIANLALAKIGGGGDQDTGSGIIASIDGNDKVSVWCKELLPSCRRKVIEEFAALKNPFRETVKYADLGAENGDPPDIGGWLYCFNLPGDYLAMVRQISEEFDSESTVKEYRHAVITTGTSRLLLTNNLTNADGDSAYIEYCFDNTDTGSYSQAFIECQASKLAAELCPILGKDIKTRQQILTEYAQYTVPKAMEFNNSQIDVISEDSTDYLGGRD